VVYFNLCGGLAPPGPPLPTPVGLGFASVLGPTRGRVAGVGNSPPPLVFGGTPQTPRHGGLRPLDPPCPPPWAWGLPAFWVPLLAGLQGLATRPLFWFLGAHPPNPLPGAVPPGPPPRPHSGRVCPLPETGNGVRGDISFLAGLHGEIGGHPRLGRRAAKGVCAW